MKFKTKVVEVEAWREGCGEEKPEWVNDIEWNFVKSNNGRNMDTELFNFKHHSWIKKADTDWLIYNGPDDIYPCDEETFQRKYEAVNGNT